MRLVSLAVMVVLGLQGTTLQSLAGPIVSAPGLEEGRDSMEKLAGDGAHYVAFVEETVAALLDRQSARLGGDPAGTLFVTASVIPTRPWTSIGLWDKDHYQLYDIPAVRLEAVPRILDFDAWALLDRLSAGTGDARYSKLVDRMADAFAQYGFHAKSGLLCHGHMSYFSVPEARTIATGVTATMPYFKPMHGLPWDRLWEAAPNQMARHCRSMYFGLVTRPSTMSYNRFVTYDYDDRRRQHVQSFTPTHCGFLYTGAVMLRCWLTAYLHSEDPETLGWARAMLEKWQAVQDPGTGLLPHYFGATVIDATDMTATPYANVMDAEVVLIFLETAALLRDHGELPDLADDIERLGRRALRGYAQHGYDPQRRLFIDWIRMEGGEYTGETFYAFRSEAEKEAALQRDPNVSRVSVFAGDRFFLTAPYHTWCVSGRIPEAIARGARLTRDPVLVERTRYFAGEVMREARLRRGALNEEQQWVFPATASYIRMLLALYEVTGEAARLAEARELADMEIRFLSERAGGPQLDEEHAEWWRMPGRCSFLEALLEVAATPGPAGTADRQGDASSRRVSAMVGTEDNMTEQEAATVRGRDETLAGMQLVMGDLPGGERRVPPDVEIVEDIDVGTYVRRKISFATEPGDRCWAWLMIPRVRLWADAEPGPGMLCLHQTTRIGKDEPAGLSGKANLHYARELAERGFTVLVPDYPGYGDYRADPYALGYASATMKGIWNHMRAVDVLTELAMVDPERVGCIGHSLGAHNALFLAAFDTRLRAVVSSCGFTRFSWNNDEGRGGEGRAISAIGATRGTCRGSRTVMHAEQPTCLSTSRTCLPPFRLGRCSSMPPPGISSSGRALRSA